MSQQPRQPLDGIRVVDLTRVVSGPFCSMLLGDMGAEVIKIEPPGKGDPVRQQGTLKEGLSWFFAAFNRNKKSVTLDLYGDEGRALLAELIRESDVLVENFRPGVLAQMGFDRARLDALNPRLVTASINGYGSTGPMAELPAFDFIIQAMSGFMSVNGGGGEAPMRTGQPITDLVGGLYAAFGIVSALRARDLNGQGQHVEAALLNGILSCMAFLGSEHLATGELPVRTGNSHPLVAPYGLFQAADGEVAVAPGNDAVARKFLRAIDLEALLDDPRYATNAERFRCRDELQALIDARMRQAPRDHWIALLNAAGVPSGEVQNLAQALAHPQVAAQEMVLEVDHPGRGLVKMLGFPVKLDQTPCTVRLPTPELGQHNDEILGPLRARLARP